MVNAMRTASSEASAQGSTLLARYLEDHPDLVSTSEAEIATASAASFAVQDEVERKMQPVMDAFNRQLAQQQEVLDRYRFLSPAILAQSALYDIAGTGTERYKHFVNLTDRFHQAWRSWFTPRVIQRAKVSAPEFASIPTYRFEEEPLAAVTGRSVVALAGMSGIAGLLLVAALASIRRYRVAG
jgi:ABC-2 type transport system permease protein